MRYLPYTPLTAATIGSTLSGALLEVFKRRNRVRNQSRSGAR
jgi:hypothetical protein